MICAQMELNIPEKKYARRICALIQCPVCYHSNKSMHTEQIYPRQEACRHILMIL